jgi:hypothetical protein
VTFMLRTLAVCLTIGVSVTSSALARPLIVTGAVPNAIQIENSLPGTTSWEIKVLSFHGEIQGYASSPSVQQGQSISFFVSTTSSSFKASIYRMGWYGGKGARLLESIPSMPGFKRKVPKPQNSTGLIACFWPKSFALTVPTTWISGIYLVKLTASNTHQAWIPFTVTDPASQSTFLFIHGVFTDEAYNDWGGKSLYTDINAPSSKAYDNRARAVAFQRPFAQNQGAGWFLSWEIHMVRFLERGGYDVGYATDLDVHEHPDILLHHKAVLVVGHDEYWSRQIRNGMDAAVAHGVNLADFAANTGYWQVRIGSLNNQPDGVIICYKTSLDPITRTDPGLTTTLWRNRPVNRPESELTGAMYGGYDGNHAPFDWVVPNPSISWIFKGSGLKRWYVIHHIVGQEADYVVHGYPHPRDLQVLSSSPFLDGASGQHFRAESTIYQAPSGAYVFDASSIDWSWGLDDIRQSFWLYPAYPKAPSPAAETITRNILLRFGH